MAPNTQGNADRWRRAIAALASLVVLALSLGSQAEPRLACSALVAGLCLVLWLTEVVPRYVPTLVLWALVPLLLAPFGSGLLGRTDLGRIDWSTLGLIAGGIALGNLLEKSGLVQVAARAAPWAQVSPFGRLLAFCFASALLSALMSITATATTLIPLAATIDPAPSTAVLIAIAASLGIPFAISTPPNAMVYGEGGLTQADLVVPGLVLMILGCVLISLTGPFVLSLVGIL